MRNFVTLWPTVQIFEDGQESSRWFPTKLEREYFRRHGAKFSWVGKPTILRLNESTICNWLSDIPPASLREDWDEE